MNVAQLEYSTSVIATNGIALWTHHHSKELRLRSVANHIPQRMARKSSIACQRIYFE